MFYLCILLALKALRWHLLAGGAAAAGEQALVQPKATQLVAAFVLVARFDRLDVELCANRSRCCRGHRSKFEHLVQLEQRLQQCVLQNAEPQVQRVVRQPDFLYKPTAHRLASQRRWRRWRRRRPHHASRAGQHRRPPEVPQPIPQESQTHLSQRSVSSLLISTLNF